MVLALFSMQQENGIPLGITEIDELQELARVETSETLKSYVIPDEYMDSLSLNIFLVGDDRIFELSVTQSPPDKTIVVSTTTVNRKTKIVSVVISNLEKKTA